MAHLKLAKVFFCGMFCTMTQKEITIPPIPEDGEITTSTHDVNIDGHIVTMSNTLTQSVHKLNVPAKRLLSYAISKLDSRAEYSPKETETTITVQQWLRMMEGVEGYEGKDPYRDMKKALEGLFDAKIIMHYTTPKGHARIKHVRWVSVAEYCEGEAKVTLCFSRPVLPHLTKLQKSFNSYRLGNVKALRSMYSWRLYELMNQWKDLGKMKVPLDKLHECLEVPESCKKTFGEMRRRVLAPAINELNRKSNLVITWEAKRVGKKVAYVWFYFGEKKQTELF
ncbi:MAG: replication initiation protein [Immundisolibacteraceae bacterium]|nr:replication initiation protein [Immundisolibacteraceae bacterium]